MTRALLVTKPIVPPWSDSSKTLVRDLVTANGGVDWHVMTARGHAPSWPRVHWEPVYRAAGAYAPSLAANARAFARLLRPDPSIGVYHYFFAPNPRTCRILRGLTAIKRKASVHTICSVPRTFEGIEKLLFTDRVVALSDFTARKLRERGVSGVVHIPPGIDPERITAPPDDSFAAGIGTAGHPTLVFAGDYEDTEGTAALLEGFARLATRHDTVRLVLACRLKTPASREHEARAREQLTAAGCADRVVFLNEVEDMGALLGLATVMVLPAGTLYRKMDIPLVLLEAMALGKPVVVSDTEPGSETLAAGGGVVVAAGRADELAHALSELLTDSERRQALGREAREAVQTHWHIRRMAERYRDLYDELLRGNA